MPRGIPFNGASNRLSRLQQRLLEDLVQSDYVAQGVGDTGFAGFASEKLEFRVTVGNVSQARDVFAIKSTGRTPTKGGSSARLASVEARIEAFERKHEALSQRIAVYLTGSR